MATENSSPSASGNPHTTPEACSEGEESLRKRKIGFEATSDSATKKSKPNDGVGNRETHSQESGSSKEKNSNDEQSYQGKKSFSIEADVAEDKGARHTMEDAWVVLPNANLDSTAKLRCAHFAIYDGHGGRLAAEYTQKHLHSNVLSAGLPLGCQSCQKVYS